MGYVLLSRSLETSPLKSNICLAASMSPKWCSPKLAFTSNKANRKAKHNFPVPCRPFLLQCNRWLAQFFMVFHSISVLVVVVHSLWVIKYCPLSANCPYFVFSRPLIFPICGHQHHDVVLLFNSEYMRRKIFKITMKCIHVPKNLVGEVGLDFFTINIVGLVSPPLDESGSIESLLIHIHKSLKNIETII